MEKCSICDRTLFGNETEYHQIINNLKTWVDIVAKQHEEIVEIWKQIQHLSK